MTPAQREVFYHRLRVRSDPFYQKALEYAECFTIKYGLSDPQALQLEESFVIFALELTGGVNDHSDLDFCGVEGCKGHVRSGL